jgi:hypothetical protein
MTTFLNDSQQFAGVACILKSRSTRPNDLSVHFAFIFPPIGTMREIEQFYFLSVIPFPARNEQLTFRIGEVGRLLPYK